MQNYSSCRISISLLYRCHRPLGTPKIWIVLSVRQERALVLWGLFCAPRIETTRFTTKLQFKNMASLEGPIIQWNRRVVEFLQIFVSLYIFLYLFMYFYVYLHVFCMFLYIFLDFFHIKLIDYWVEGASGAPHPSVYQFYVNKNW